MQSLTINARVDILSCEKLYPAAEALSEKIPPLTLSQINGFKNIARCAPEVSKIRDYASNQLKKTKGLTADKEAEVKKCWETISKEITSIGKLAAELGEEMSLDKKAKQELELLLVRELVYHLSAEQIFRQKKGGG